MSATAAVERFDNHWSYAEEVEVLTFDLNGETFALEAVIVQEILDLLPETAVPGSQPFVASVINFRGKVIPLADLRLAFGMEAAEATIDSRFIVIEIDLQGEQTLVGLRTDKVNEVTTLAKSASEAPPSVGMRWRADYINCLVKRGGEFIILPNLQAIFSSRHNTARAVT
ncbi:purine-binding chemotaxis protein CheW [Rhizobium leguminosarum]|uniref:Purine-binding chemotaxis protein CheW n=1 Tax=Rhizobium leguminosarum TaxID=384 RepID=A0AAE2MNE3_RHILE|nr:MULTISPECIES: chemotaxis protein CheW [Rhizobium]MBB4292908.1 purine-binding chemotaxis protein CheW [Rhizobium leguminosarum]MBB4299056.1 purine-binding chemotaxis protein CheW [Rhizobium leguminosarum]MBB4310555.1 purine-binding chemotaxis protein CheW [Rhizobium leguminosarum]MBB4419671.1 purine-binding chemotaxis protein CheW [Rhizobium leguminosarum]MBB4434817.1 purine-binding chemotaxis protein CheW [Rhizobium esperanzae]